MRELRLNLLDGIATLVPATLQAITTYVMLEQETWFEKELSFVRRWMRPGMVAIDIGANLGAYSLPMAKIVGLRGRVIAFEPGGQPRRLLKKSGTLNRFRCLEVVPLALSDSAREGFLSAGDSSELSALGADGEAVQISTLDLEAARRAWPEVDFVKIDAEGEEERILAGGQGFFRENSPVVMFEVRAGSTINEGLREAFAAMGYGIYRLLASELILVPASPAQSLDSYELNLFAVKPDRAAQLAQEGFLVEKPIAWSPNEGDRREAVAQLQLLAQSAAPVDVMASDPEYLDALAGFCRWRTMTIPVAERVGALMAACELLEAACRRSPSIARLSTLARAAADAGFRDRSVDILLGLN